MKGPGARYDVDVRRVWQCPSCGQRMRLPATIAARRCKCTSDGPWMQIVDEHVRRVFPEREKIVIPEELPPVDEAESSPSGSSGNAASRVDASERSEQTQRDRRGKPGQRPRKDRPPRTPDPPTALESSGGTSSAAESSPEPPAPAADPPADDGFGANIF